MKARLLSAAGALLCALGLTLCASAQTTTITASSISMGGVPISAGTVTFTGVNTLGTPIAFSSGGGGLNGTVAFSCTISAGAITGTCTIPDSALTTPAHILYTIQVINTTSHTAFTLERVTGITGTTWPLDHYGPPSPTSGVQPVQTSYGTAAPTGSCVTPSLYVRNASGGQLYVCVAASWVLVTSASVPALGASGPSHQAGVAPDPGSTAGTTRYLREDATWATPAGGGGTVPTGTGFTHITSGSQDSAARAVNLAGADVSGTLPAANVQALGASGGGHQAGVAPDPGGTSGTSRFLREDATWATPAGGGGMSAPGGSGVVYWNGSATTDATPAQLATALRDPTKNSYIDLAHGTSGNDSTDNPTSATQNDYIFWSDAAHEAMRRKNGYPSSHQVDASATVTLTDASTITYDANSVWLANASLTLNHATSSRTLDLVTTDLEIGESGVVLLKQDSTGGATTLVLGSGAGSTCNWLAQGGHTLTLTSTANAVDTLTWWTPDGTNCYAVLGKNYTH
jgi:hypothetical protein